MQPWLMTYNPSRIMATFPIGRISLRMWTLDETRSIQPRKVRKVGDLLVRRGHAVTRRTVEVAFDSMPLVTARRLLQLINRNLGRTSIWQFPDNTKTGGTNGTRTVWALAKDPVLAEYRCGCKFSLTLSILKEVVNGHTWREN